MSQERDYDEEGRFEISESDVDEGTDRVGSPRKCSGCRRPCSEHKGGPTGRKCKLEPLDEEQGKERYKEWNAKRRKNNTPVRDNRSTSASSLPDMAGSAPSGRTAPSKVTPGVESQLSIESRIVQRLLTAIQDISPAMPILG